MWFGGPVLYTCIDIAKLPPSHKSAHTPSHTAGLSNSAARRSSLLSYTSNLSDFGRHLTHIMATKEALEGLKKTGDALQEIKKQLQPFIHKLETAAEGKALAQAQAAVALSVGTLRYMGARLRGLDQGRNDALRQELNEMRRVLTAVEKLKDDTDVTKKKNERTAKAGEKKSPTKRKAEDIGKRCHQESPREEKKTSADKKRSSEKKKRSSPSPKKRQRKR